eukprot:TRINITY_DN28758_c0_g1_i1.p1 TRINITY_DN28758_c0_g1~~TRINITY_DN28758_c0_g1_i1.p1  ORF type:complete len:106 (-),score=24.98 TRINITY_DN28758_c0_g1_i1:75-392(-)
MANPHAAARHGAQFHDINGEAGLGTQAGQAMLANGAAQGSQQIINNWPRTGKPDGTTATITYQGVNGDGNHEFHINVTGAKREAMVWHRMHLMCKSLSVPGIFKS